MTTFQPILEYGHGTPHFVLKAMKILTAEHRPEILTLKMIHHASGTNTK